MVACKVFFAVALVSVALVQINAKPLETEEWAAPFEAALKNMTSKFTEMVGDTSLYTNLANSSFSTYADNFKTDLSTLSKTFEGKSGVSDAVKEATKQWHTAVEEYTKNIPTNFTELKLNEKFDSTLKYITQKSSELSKKAQGNTEVEKEIKEFTKKQVDALMEQVKSIQTKITEKKP